MEMKNYIIHKYAFNNILITATRKYEMFNNL